MVKACKGTHGKNMTFPKKLIRFHRLVLLLLIASILTIHQTVKVVGLHDSIFDFVSYEDTSEWDRVYLPVCKEDYRDYYREPRVKEKSEDLKAPRESKSPIAIETNAVEPSSEEHTLQIYNNFGVRNGYSVSYGFQRNKECVHGTDSDCVISPDFGRVRAVVLNAERYSEGQSFNFIKDHFLIEDPEKFVTILNGGSEYERKFSEAVFLGGYNPAPVENHMRSSHRINGKSYPLEIYMYFVDESVPAVGFSTILVVLVEEDENDNPQVKPIISAVKDKLYDEERRFIANNKYLFRREKLIHHLAESINYDVNRKETLREGKTKDILMDMLETSEDLERNMATLQDTFEHLQSLDSRMQHIDELETMSQDTEENLEIGFNDFIERVAHVENEFPFEYEELHRIALASMIVTFNIVPSFRKAADCTEKFQQHFDPYSGETSWYLNFNNRPPTEFEKSHGKNRLINNTKHHAQWKKIFSKVCNFVVERHNWTVRNENITIMKDVTDSQKYSYIKELYEITEKQKELDGEVADHFSPSEKDDEDSGRHMHNAGNLPKLQNPYLLDEWVTILVEMEDKFSKRPAFKKYKKMLAKDKDKLRRGEGFEGVKTMEEVIHFLKHGTKNVKRRRDIIHDAIYKNFLPSQEKRRGFPELGNMNIAEADIDEMKTLSPIKVNVEQNFQISWLIPKDGGYFFYKGSSPIPPCFHAQNVIVFKKPITMSKFQIETLTRVPTSFDKLHDINVTTPFIHGTFFSVDLRADHNSPYRHEEVKVKIYHQPKNHLFLGHDGFHKNTVEAYEARTVATTETNSSTSGRNFLQQPILCGFCLLLIIISQRTRT